MNNDKHIAEFYVKSKDRLIKRASYRVGLNNAEDVVQELFLRIKKSYHSWDPTKGKFSRWIETIFQRCIYDQLNRDRLDSQMFSGSYEELPEHLEPHYDDDTAEACEQIDRVYDMIVKTKQPDRDILYMYFFMGYTIKEIENRLLSGEDNSEHRTEYKIIQRIISRFKNRVGVK